MYKSITKPNKLSEITYQAFSQQGKMGMLHAEELLDRLINVNNQVYSEPSYCFG